VLIGTTAFNGAPDFSYADHAVAQGQKVGAAIVALTARSYSVTSHEEDLVTTGVAVDIGAPSTYLASYWAKADPANTCGSN